MAIDDLPPPVVNLLNAIGVPWPYLNEDTVPGFAALVREFRQAVQTTHQDATEAVAAITRAHQSVSTERMQAGWENLTARHVDELTAGCTTNESALRRLDRPHQTEGLAGRIGVDAPVRAGPVQSGGADVKGGPFRRVHVLDGHVEVDLLRERRPATGNRR